jgi:hypothetical protein
MGDILDFVAGKRSASRLSFGINETPTRLPKAGCVSLSRPTAYGQIVPCQITAIYQPLENSLTRIDIDSKAVSKPLAIGGALTPSFPPASDISLVPASLNLGHSKIIR